MFDILIEIISLPCALQWRLMQTLKALGLRTALLVQLVVDAEGDAVSRSIFDNLPGRIR